MGDYVPLGKEKTSNGNDCVDLGLTRDLKAARKAYKTMDRAQMVKAHNPQNLRNREGDEESTATELIKSFVFGGVDGIVTIFAVVAAINGADLNVEIILLIGFSNLLADAIAMGIGDYLSEKAELDFIASEQAREKWELENYPEGERKEMIEVYENKGLSNEEATTVIDIFMRHPDVFLTLMMKEELDMIPAEGANPAKNGLVTFISFMVCGSVPLWIYGGAKLFGFDDPKMTFIITCFAVALTLFGLGFVKAKLTMQKAVFKSALLMMVTGGIAASSAYITGWGLKKIFNVDESSM
eukprot:TRINITY_DN7004_c0_g1_i1.p1 TRINITY_DN7004_c0_g1~~TRINITY_DN7004_c0_g1_i1.p1  ORF type:complete len:297 (-),score=94.52 TRINITY_DN7004_c0_g1_i1:576-1466(-)